jgi:hypothetical protein
VHHGDHRSRKRESRRRGDNVERAAADAARVWAETIEGEAVDLRCRRQRRIAATSRPRRGDAHVDRSQS